LNPTVGKEKSDSQEKELKFTALGWKLGFHSKVREMEMSVIIFFFYEQKCHWTTHSELTRSLLLFTVLH
jgi:hypothetical protein